MMGMNGVGSAGMTPEMVAYYQQQQLLAANSGGGTAGIPRFAPTQFGQVPPEFKPEDTNSAFLVPTLVGAGIGTVGGAFVYNDSRRKFVTTEIDNRIKQQNETLGKAQTEEFNKLTKTSEYKTELQKITQAAGDDYVQKNQSNAQLGKNISDIIADPKQKQALLEQQKQALLDHLKAENRQYNHGNIDFDALAKGDLAPNEIIQKYIEQTNIGDDAAKSNFTKSSQQVITDTDQKFARNFNEQQRLKELQKGKQLAAKNAAKQYVTAEQAKISAKPEFAQLDANTGKAHVLNVSADDVTKNTNTFKKAQTAFGKSVLENADLNPAGKRYGTGKAALAFTALTAVGAGIGLWNASQASSRNEDKANQLALLRQQEAAANAGGTPLVGGGGFAPA